MSVIGGAGRIAAGIKRNGNRPGVYQRAGAGSGRLALHLEGVLASCLPSSAALASRSSFFAAEPGAGVEP